MWQKILLGHSSTLSNLEGLPIFKIFPLGLVRNPFEQLLPGRIHTDAFEIVTLGIVALSAVNCDATLVIVSSQLCEVPFPGGRVIMKPPLCILNAGEQFEKYLL